MFNKELMDQTIPTIEEIKNLNIYVSWSWPGCGWGEFYAKMREDGKFEIDEECMSKESVRKILHSFVDKFVDEQLDVGDKR